MKKSVSPFYWIACIAILSAACSDRNLPPPTLTYSGDSPRVQNPLKPEESRRHIQVPEGFSVELYAAEPNIINPIAFTWDEKGRLWVVQSQDYPHGIENDVGGDRITICEDTDGDGKADKFTNFATDQSLTTGIVLVNGGAIVSQAPNMVFLKDTDGDDTMDERTVLFDGFGTWDTHAGPSSLRYGMDNAIWGAVGYSDFKNTFQGKEVEFDMGVYRFAVDGSNFEPVGQFNNNTWGMGFNEHFEIFGSTANNNHCCYVGIPLRYYEYLDEMPSWGVNADFIQGHYEIHPVDTVPLQQVDVRGGYTAAAGANFYTARNYPEKYRNQMYVCEPTGHLVHIAQIEKEGAGYKEVDGGNIFASTDAWTAPVFAETGPDGNLWVADWYNPVIQHNPDKRGMENQIWNADKGEGNAHINQFRDYGHGRIYILRYEDGDDSNIASLDREDSEGLLAALGNDNLFWRITAQRLLVECSHTELIPELVEMARNSEMTEERGLNAGALHALWTLDGLGAFDGLDSAMNALPARLLSHNSYAVKRAALSLLPKTTEASVELARSGMLTDANLQLRLAALLKASELPESGELYTAMEASLKQPEIQSDKWLSAAANIYFKEVDYNTIDPSLVEMLLPSSEEGTSPWAYTEQRPSSEWMMLGYDDSEWRTGNGMFGNTDMEGTATEWASTDIWLRRTITLKGAPDEPVLKIRHDDDYEVYVNGELLMEETGASEEYKYLLFDATKGALFQSGKNTIAVHCKNTGGNQFIDLGIGKKGKIKTDKVFALKTVSQEMAYDRTILRAEAGQTIEIRLDNVDQMPHNLVVIQPGSLELFGPIVDDFVTNPEAEERGYVPNSRYVLGATPMLGPSEKGSVVITLPDVPGRYPFVCTFPGHWRMMQGVLLVSAPGSYISEEKDAPNIAVMGGGGSHDFLKFFGIADGAVLSDGGMNNVVYTEDSELLGTWVPQSEVVLLSNNKPLNQETREALFSGVNSGNLSLLINHPSTWYNWADWPEYNAELVGGGSRSHEDLQEFEVRVTKPDHPIMKGVPTQFRIVDELYRWEKDPGGTDVEVLAIGRGIESGEEFPVVWVVKHPNAKIVGNTLGHDERAHGLKAYQALLKNSLDWVLSEGNP